MRVGWMHKLPKRPYLMPRSAICLEKLSLRFESTMTRGSATHLPPRFRFSNKKAKRMGGREGFSAFWSGFDWWLNLPFQVKSLEYYRAFAIHSNIFGHEVGLWFEVSPVQSDSCHHEHGQHCNGICVASPRDRDVSSASLRSDILLCLILMYEFIILI